MLTGNFRTVPIDFIWVDREKRQRRDLGKLDELKDSINRSGLIHPPVIRETGELVAGERRWTSCTQLGWTEIPVQFAEDLDELSLHIIELEENTRRMDIDWKDQCLAVERYHQLRADKDKSWTADRTAEALGLDNVTVSQKRAVAREILEGNERVASAPKYSVARNIVARSSERKKAAALESLDLPDEQALPEPAVAESRAPILNESFLEWAPAYTGQKFNLIHCDFPYGVNADKHAQGASAEYGGYSDSLDVYVQLIECLRMSMDNVVSPYAHLIFWFSMDYYQMTRDHLEHMGWRVNPFPLIWHKTDNSGILPDPNRGPRRIYETAFFCSRGDAKIVQAVGNCVGHANTKSIHMSEKPVAMLSHFFRMVVDEHTRLLDPTAGSGSSLRAAKTLGAPTVLGLEIDPDFYRAATEAWNDHER